MLQPGFIPALDGLGVTDTTAGTYKEALPVFERITNIWPEGPHAFYRIACLYARQNDANESIHWLKAAVARRFSDWNLIQTDDNLPHVKGSPIFEAIIKGN